MHSTTTNTLNRRPRGYSTHNHIPPTIQEESSILPQFLRRLSSRNSFRGAEEDSYDRVEKMMNGGSVGTFGNGGGLRYSVAMPGSAIMRGRLFKILAVALVFFTATYFLLPWSSSFAPLERITRSSSSSYTKVCSKPHDPSKQLVQYALMIDAGSTGSRIHVYKFHNCFEAPTLEHETFEQIKPGLSAYANSPERAAESLDALLDIAVSEIPKELQSCTPLAVKATAGLRLLGESQSLAILEAVEKRIHSKYPFPLPEKDGVIIMEGKDEGVYAWITTNYLLGNIGGKDRKSTAGVFDLGGASTQIVFEPTLSLPTSTLSPGDHEYVLTFAGHTYTLYQHSHLGYGLMEARKQIHRHIYQTNPHSNDVVNPCLPPGTDTHIEIAGQRIHMVGPSVSSPLQCRAIAEQILNKTAPCGLIPCAFNGVHMPKLTETFPSSNDVYLFSYFYDRTQPLGVPSSFSLHELRHLTHQVCAGADAWGAFDAIAGAREELAEIGGEWCLDLNFMDALLVAGYEFNLERGVKSVKKVDGNEVGWCLGASLPMLEGSGWSCKIQEIH